MPCLVKPTHHITSVSPNAAQHTIDKEQMDIQPDLEAY